MNDVALTHAPDVRSALTSDGLITPTTPASLRNGSTAALRYDMARFTDGDAHNKPRAAVERAIDRIDAGALRDIAEQRTRRWITNTFDARELAFAVPAESLALALDTKAEQLSSVLADVEQIVRAIGRGEEATVEIDAATDRLTRHFERRADGAVATVSLLYQVFDSSAALFSVSLLAERSELPRRNALAKTVRQATADVTIGGTNIKVGEVVAVSLEADGFEFGAGRHKCPGEVLAQAIVDGMLRALTAVDLLLDDVELDGDGRPTTLPMQHR